jgi:hypothetical protein
MTGNPETFRQGATVYRNARDWAKEQRDKAIQQANDRAIPVEEAEATAGNASGCQPSFKFRDCSVRYRGLHHEPGISDIAE